MVHSLLKKIRVFWILGRIRALERLENRGQFFIFSVSSIIWLIVSIMFYGVLIKNYGSLGGWGFYEMVVLSGVINFIINFGFAFWERSFFRMSQNVVGGKIDIILTKPVEAKFFLTFFNMDFIFSWPQIIFPIGIMIFGIIKSEAHVNPVMFILTLLLSLILNFSIHRFVTSINFFQPTGGSDSFLVGRILDLGHYPKGIYNSVWRNALTFVIPVLFVFTFPVEVLFGKTKESDYIFFLIIVGVFYYLSGKFMDYGIKHYESKS